MPAARLQTILWLLALALIVSGAAAQDCDELQDQACFLGMAEGRDYLGAVPGGDDRILAITSDAQLIVLQQNPAGAPAEIGQHSLDSGDGWIAGIGQTVYVSGSNGVKVLQIQPDGSVVSMGYLAGQEASAEIKAGDDLLAVIHDGAWSLWDCTTPTTPALLARTEFVNSASILEQAHVALGSQYAVVNELVFDLTDPANPLPLPDLPAPSSLLHGQELVGQNLYQFRVSYADGGSWIYGDRWFFRQYMVTVLDLSDSDEYPTEASHSFRYSTAFPLSAPRVVMSLSEGRILAGQTSDPNLLVIDTTLPADAEPYRVPVFPAPVQVFQNEQLLGLGTENWTFAVPATMDPGTVPMPSVGEGGGFPCGGGYDSYGLFDVDARDDWLAVSTGYSYSNEYLMEEFSFVNLYRTVGGELQPVSSMQNWGQWEQLALGEEHLFLSAYSLFAVDITDPANPQDPVQVPGISAPYGLTSLGGELFAVGNSTGVLSIWNLADPTVPALVGSCDLGERAWKFVRDGQVLLAALYSSPQVVVVDLGNPAAPQVVQSVNMPGTVRKLAGQDGRAVAISNVDGQLFQVDFDYQVPGGPAPTGTVVTTEIPMYINGLVWHGQQVFLGGSGVHVYDPEQAAYVGSLATSHSFLGLVSHGGDLHAVTAEGLEDITEIVCGVQGVSSVGPDFQGLPAVIDLTAAPNPFNPLTRFSFNLDRQESATLVVYDVKGRAVRQLLNEVRPAGPNFIEWNGRGDSGRQLASGMYIGRLETTSGAAVFRVMLLK